MASGFVWDAQNAKTSCRICSAVTLTPVQCRKEQTPWWASKSSPLTVGIPSVSARCKNRVTCGS